jgi:hypothetical protein
MYGKKFANLIVISIDMKPLVVIQKSVASWEASSHPKPVYPPAHIIATPAAPSHGPPLARQTLSENVNRLPFIHLSAAPSFLCEPARAIAAASNMMTPTRIATVPKALSTVWTTEGQYQSTLGE